MPDPRRPASGRRPDRSSARGTARPHPSGGRGRSTGRTSDARPSSRANGTTTSTQGTRTPSTSAGTAGQASPSPRPARRFTGRSAVLAVVLAVLVVSYASSLRAYLQQRAHINALRAEIAASSTDISRLQREQRRWSDDHYVIDQARARFGWVLPGEKAYQVVGRDGKALRTGDRLTDRDDAGRGKPEAWWTTQYDSLRAADHPTKKVERRPAASIPADAR